ncbi:uncharacterized protein HMPREF1541_09821 [Cyphellophora europaea CBS 101466]|uniref:Aflatoxin regulatory protein domain-containing protein n=1 Tax=Cyphellophora europaea (strain CBS 101466) TaxID=1220924 RepID=W2S8B8_CYPE1|nr:uncharacterized protein HMPREF1541_09821 [Cyphellophora europaea CBS 101466]ETN44946.1 hypothetical protein HMPREF1541_09821 [Cyphellophora europaea CBS 101466]
MDNMGMSQPCLSQWGGIDASKRFPYTSFEQPPPPAPSTAEMPNPFEISPSASSRSLDTMMGSDLSMPWNTGFSFSSTPATMSNSPPDSDGLDHGNDHYANLLSCTKQVRLCYATLQSQIRGTMRGQRCPQPQLEAALKIVESSCRASCDILRHSSSSSASMPSPNWSLIAQAITLVFNIIDICELLVEGTVGPQADGGAVATTRQTTLDDLYVIKRLELSVVQTRMSLNQVQDLNQSFASLVQGTKSRIMALQALFESVKCSH